MQTEDTTNDLKLTIDPKDPRAMLELIKDIVSFANSGGGTLEIGSSETCQGRNEMPQDRRSKVPQKRRFEKSPASVVLLHRGRRGKMTEHAGFQFLLQAIALAANVDGDGMMQQAVQDGRRDHMVVKNVTPGAVALVAG